MTHDPDEIPHARLSIHPGNGLLIDPGVALEERLFSALHQNDFNRLLLHGGFLYSLTVR